MKRLAAICALLTLAVVLCSFQLPQGGVTAQSSGGGGKSFARSQFVDTTNSCPSTGTTCTIPVAATAATHLGAIYCGVKQPSVWISSVSGAGTWAEPAGTQNYYTTAGDSISGAYNLTETAGTTSIVVTFSATLITQPNCSYIDYTVTGGTAVFDTSGAATQSAHTTALPGVTLTLTGAGANELVLQAQTYGVPTSISGGSPAYGNFQDPWYVATADSINTTSGAAPTWNYAAPDFANTSAMAFK